MGNYDDLRDELSAMLAWLHLSMKMHCPKLQDPVESNFEVALT